MNSIEYALAATLFLKGMHFKKIIIAKYIGQPKPKLAKYSITTAHYYLL